jgi:hypothetical protein
MDGGEHAVRLRQAKAVADFTDGEKALVAHGRFTPTGRPTGAVRPFASSHARITGTDHRFGRPSGKGAGKDPSLTRRIKVNSLTPSNLAAPRLLIVSIVLPLVSSANRARRLGEVIMVFQGLHRT